MLHAEVDAHVFSDTEMASCVKMDMKSSQAESAKKMEGAARACSVCLCFESNVASYFLSPWRTGDRRLTMCPSFSTDCSIDNLHPEEYVC